MESIRSLAGLLVRTFFTRRFERFRSTSFRRDNRDRNGRTSHSHVPFLSAIIVITIEHRRASHSDWERREGGRKKMRGNSSLDRSEEYAASSQRDSLDNVCIYSTDRRRKNSKHEEMKACCQLVRVLKAIGFSNHAFCELFNLKKKKKKYQKCLERSNKRYALYIFVSFSLTRFQLFHPSPLPRKETYNCLSKSNEKKEKLF